jgi:hypothetical protein
MNLPHGSINAMGLKEGKQVPSWKSWSRGQT